MNEFKKVPQLAKKKKAWVWVVYACVGVCGVGVWIVGMGECHIALHWQLAFRIRLHIVRLSCNLQA